jgi:type 1 glutamine amidotransferase
MKRIFSFFAAFVLAITGAKAAPAKIKCLIVDGQNNHNWQQTTPVLKTILLNTGVFEVDVSTTPPQHEKPAAMPKQATAEQKKAHAEAMRVFQEGASARAAAAKPAWDQWQPRFQDYGVVISNYNGEEWPKENYDALIEYVRSGGGFVSYHAADNAFGNQSEYNEMIGLGGWGGRNATSGPYLRLRDGAWKPVEGRGPCGGHGPAAEFIIETFAPEHPIMKGLPPRWMHAKDELYHSLRGPAKNLSVLGHALSEETHEQEPMLMAISYGKGRVFHTTLGHHLDALDGLGFQITFTRGAEWAATGKVTQPAPKAGELTEGPKASLRPIKRSPANP